MNSKEKKAMEAIESAIAIYPHSVLQDLKVEMETIFSTSSTKKKTTDKEK